MKLNDFLSVMAVQSLGGNVALANNNYKHEHFIIPRVVCADGFSISIQVNKSNYCGSENGYREFGRTWTLVEWGFPSEEIDGEKYNAEGLVEPTTDSVGSIEIEVIEELLDEHGGIDLYKTFEMQMEKIELGFKGLFG